MLRKFIYILPLILNLAIIPKQSHGQNFSQEEQSKIDSAEAIINDSASHDTSLASAYVFLSEMLAVSNLDTVIPLCISAKNVAEKSLKRQPSNLETHSLKTSLARALNNIGYINYSRSNIPDALDYYHRSLKLQEELGDKEGIATGFNNIGAIYEKNGDIPTALSHYHKSLKLREEIGYKPGIAISLNNIGLVYKHQGDIPNALDYYQRSLKIQEELGNKQGIGLCLNNIGLIYKLNGDIPEALDHLQRSLKLKEEIGDKRGIALCLNNIGTIYRIQGDRVLALSYHERSLKIRKELSDKYGTAIGLHNIGTLEREIGEFARARTFGEQGLEIAQDIGSPRLISLNSELLSMISKQEGNFQEALQMYELHILMKDSINNKKTQKATIRQQTKYEFEKAQLVKEQDQKELARIEAEKTSRRDNLQYSVILIALLVLFGGVLSLGFIKVSTRMAEGIVFFSFLILFEFFLVMADPYIDNWSGGAPGIKLLFNAGIAALVFPMHSWFEGKLKSRLLENK